MEIIAKENLQPAVARTLSAVTLIAQPLVDSATLTDQPDVEPGQAEFHLRLDDGIPVSVKHENRAFDVTARFGKVKWSLYETIANGCRRLTAQLTELEIDEVRISQILHIEGNDGSLRLTIQLPPTFAEVVASRPFLQAIESFLRQVKCGEYSKPEEDLFPMDLDVSDPGAFDKKIETDNLVQEIAKEVRAVVGGRTLPGGCTVESPLWKDHFELCGILGPKPEIEQKPPEDIPLTCGVDGYRKRARVVYLFPNFPVNAASIEVSFDEKEWLETIKDAAALEGQLFNARFDEVKTGTKITRKLTALAKCDGNHDSLLVS